MTNTFDNDDLSVTRKYLLAFTSLFSDISINQRDTSNNVFKSVKVPILWSSNEKWFSLYTSPISGRLNFEGNNAIEISANLPMMSVGSVQLTPSLEDQWKKYSKIEIGDSTVYAPAVYNITTELNILTGLLDHNTKILEKILPYFVGSLSMNINMGEELILSNISVPVRINSISGNIPIDIGSDANRIIGCQINFTLGNVLMFPNISEEQYSNLKITVSE